MTISESSMMVLSARISVTVTSGIAWRVKAFLIWPVKVTVSCACAATVSTRANMVITNFCMLINVLLLFMFAFV